MSTKAQQEKDFLRGFFIAVATMARAGEDSSAWNVIEGNGFGPTDFEGLGLQDFDLRALRRIVPDRVRRYAASRRAEKAGEGKP